jgi:UDPglucose 6-dehydrogenase
MSIAVIGQGFVGGSLTTVFSERGEEVYVYDKAKKTSSGGISGFLIPAKDELFIPSNVAEFVVECEKTPRFSGIYFVCVPTPMYPDGSCDTSIVDEVLSEIANVPLIKKPKRIVVIKSTIPPGTTEKFNQKFGNKMAVIFNPEFLTEANALQDMREQNRIILGGPRPYINSVRNVFMRAFPKVPIIKTSSTTAEMVKYVTNCTLAVKVSLANEFSQICESLDEKGHNIDYDKVIEYAKFDKRLGDSHWSVPGPVPTEKGEHVRGFGGHCFPKDINALIYVANENGVNPTVLQAAWNKNLEVRPPEHRDWEKQEGRAVSRRKDA